MITVHMGCPRCDRPLIGTEMIVRREEAPTVRNCKHCKSRVTTGHMPNGAAFYKIIWASDHVEVGAE